MTPRIPALGRAHIQPGLLELPAYRRSASEDPFNIYRTLAHHPSIVTQWLGFADALRFDGQLSGRDRELLILRTAVNCNCEYEWGQHVSYAEASGVRDDEFRALRRPLDDWPWSQSDRVLLSAADELHATSDIAEATWHVLAETYDYKQLIEINMVVGQYHLVSYVLNGLRIERDAMLPPFPPIDEDGGGHPDPVVASPTR